MLLSIITVLVLVMMVWFDFKYRLIPLWLFIVLAMVCFGGAWQSIPMSELLLSFSVNTIVIVVLLLGGWVWLGLIRESWAGILDIYMGKGDLLFMLIVGLYFSPVFFIAFNVFSVSLLLVIYGMYILVSGNRNYPIPLAGAQAFFLSVFEVGKHFMPVGLQYRDQYLIHYLLAELC